jgi:hypothetical protein
VPAAAALARLRTSLQKDREDLRDRIAKGLPRKAYWTNCGKLMLINAVLEEVNTLIKAENSGDDEDAGSEKD